MIQTNNRALKSLINSFTTKKIAVIGDLILDVYLWGEASRISQEAPVPVLKVNKRTERPGGAANVMCNIVSLGGHASAYGITGNDSNARRIKKLMSEHNIDTTSVFEDSGRKTTEKQRIIAGSQQLVRIDHEDLHEVDLKLRRLIVEHLVNAIKNKEYDAVIFEDYAKGMLDVNMASEISEAAEEAGVLVGLDPHPGHPLDISHITVMTPNRSEAYGLAGVYCSASEDETKEDAQLAQIAEKIHDKWNPEYLLITLGARGMALFEKGKKAVIIPTIAQEVFDVSGAGDTVIAAFTLAILAGATGPEAAEIANHAAGVVVGKVGTVSVTTRELVQCIDCNS